MPETEPYRPSNGHEGEIFMSDFCWRCRRDTEAAPCEIIGRTMSLYEDDPDYPKEWVRVVDDDEWPGTARCTAFEPKDDAGAIRDGRQEALL